MSVEKLIFEKGAPGRRAATMTAMDVPTESLESMIPANMLRKDPAPLPEVSEIEVVRHYTHLSQRNFGIDTGFYPLGSCTMKARARDIATWCSSLTTPTVPVPPAPHWPITRQWRSRPTQKRAVSRWIT